MLLINKPVAVSFRLLCAVSEKEHHSHSSAVEMSCKMYYRLNQTLSAVILVYNLKLILAIGAQNLPLPRQRDNVNNFQHYNLIYDNEKPYIDEK